MIMIISGDLEEKAYRRKKKKKSNLCAQQGVYTKEKKKNFPPPSAIRDFSLATGRERAKNQPRSSNAAFAHPRVHFGQPVVGETTLPPENGTHARLHTHTQSSLSPWRNPKIVSVHLSVEEREKRVGEASLPRTRGRERRAEERACAPRKWDSVASAAREERGQEN